jgi:hypothetical protein
VAHITHGIQHQTISQVNDGEAADDTSLSRIYISSEEYKKHNSYKPLDHVSADKAGM